METRHRFDHEYLGEFSLFPAITFKLVKIANELGYNKFMNAEITLPLDKMTIAEKLEVMELIWADLAKNPNDIPSPEWHGEFLRDREKALADGTDRFIDWEEAKRLIREQTS